MNRMGYLGIATGFDRQPYKLIKGARNYGKEIISFDTILARLIRYQRC